MEAELRHEGVEEAHWVVSADVVVEYFRKEHGLGAIGTNDVGHERSSEKESTGQNTGRTIYGRSGVFTQAPHEAVGAWFF